MWKIHIMLHHVERKQFSRYQFENRRKNLNLFLENLKQEANENSYLHSKPMQFVA